MIDEVLYEDPKFVMKHTSDFEESVEEVYDNIDEANAIRDLNKFPPPVWKQSDGLDNVPPPLPPSHPSRRYTRTFNQSGSEDFIKIDEWRANIQQSPSKSSSSKPQKKFVERGSPKTKFSSLKTSHRVKRNDKTKGKPPTPPTKPRKFGSSDDLLSTNSSELTNNRGGGREGGGGKPVLGFNLKNDPRFGQKLEERRQEIYGDQDRNRPRSWGHDQEHYEEVPVTTSDDDILSSSGEGRPGFQGPFSPSEDEYVDCEPHDDDEGPQQYLDFETVIKGNPEKMVKVSNTLKREEFLKRPPLPLPPQVLPAHSFNPPPPKVPIGGRALLGPASVAPLPRSMPLSSTGSDSPPPIPRRGNERPPLPIPPGETGVEDEDEAPPVPRRHPQASDRHRTRVTPEQRSPPRGSPPENPIPLPPRSLSPTSSPLSSLSDNAPPVPHRGNKQVDASSPPVGTGRFAYNPRMPNFNKAPPPLPRNKSLTSDEFSSPSSANSDHVFEEFTFGAGPPPPPLHSLTQENMATDKSSRTKGKVNPHVPSKTTMTTNQSKLESYETRLPPDIGMKPPLAKKKIASYEVNLPPSIGNRPTASQPDTRPRPNKPPVASKKPVLPKPSPQIAAKPQVTKKPVIQSKPPIITPKPAAVPSATTGRPNTSAITGNSVGSVGGGGAGGNSIVNQLRENFNNRGGGTPTTSSLPPKLNRSFNSNDNFSARPVTSKPAFLTGPRKPGPAAATSKPRAPIPPNKPKPILPPPTVDRRKPLPTPSVY